MRLLVSVTCAAEALAALAGGADLIDAKDPLAGALGAVSADVLREIYAVVADRRPVTAALGDACDEAAIRSEEHTSELQSHHDLVCRLLLEKKKQNRQHNRYDKI